MDFAKKKLAVLALNVVVVVASLAASTMLQNLQIEEALNDLLKTSK